jgi:vancomycin resistance protein YoaR
MRKTLFIIVTLVLFGIASGFITSLLYLRNRIYPNISIAGVSVGRLTKDEALQKLKKTIKEKQKDNIQLKYENSEWVLDLNALRFKALPKISVKKAYSLRGLGQLLEKEKSLALDFNLDRETLSSQVATISAQLYFPAQEPLLKVAKDKISITVGQDGQQLNEQKTIKLITNNLSKIDFNEVALPVKQLNFAISDDQLNKTKKRAQGLLSKKLIVKVDQNIDILSNQELIDLLDFNGSFSSEKITTFAATLAASYNRPPQNATIQIANGRATLFKPSIYGIKLNEISAIEQIKEALIKLEKGEEVNLTVSLVISRTKPEIANKDVNDLGINELLGRGISYYYGSAASRIHNLSLAASRVNGTLVPPGGTFSFNESVGDISALTGFQSAYIIKDGRTILGDGGGVCQDSTTLFRAVLDAGLPIVERRAHSYRVVYYEKGGYKPGLDATVFAPTSDLKFKNDTPAHILVQAYVIKGQSKLTYEIYGTSDGRQSTIRNHRVWDQVAPPQPRYQDDPTLPAGTVKQVDFAAWGAKAAFDWKVVRNGETIIERTFYSNFRPWQAVYLRGTGG